MAGQKAIPAKLQRIIDANDEERERMRQRAEESALAEVDMLEALIRDLDPRDPKLGRLNDRLSAAVRRAQATHRMSTWLRFNGLR